MNRLRVGDEVLVVAGNNKGQKGKIARIDYELGRVIVEGVNLVKRHTRATPRALAASCSSPRRSPSRTFS